MRRAARLIISASTLGLFVATGPASAGQWSATPTLVSTLNTNTSSPVLATSDDGSRAVAVWRAASGASFKIQTASASISKGVATWGTPSDLSTAGKTANFPRVEVSSDGTRATAVWTETDANNNSLVASSSAIIDGKTASWGASKFLSRTGADAVGSSVDLALSSDGTKAVVSFAWNSSGTNLAYVSVGSISGGTASWTGATSAISEAGVAVNSTAVDMPATGGAFLVAWNTPNGVRASAATVVGGVPFMEASSTLISGTTTLTASPTVRLSGDGKQAVAAFLGKAAGATASGVHVATATVSGRTTTWSSAPTQLSGAGYAASNASLAVSTDGKTALMGWLRADAAIPRVETIVGTVAGTSATWGSISPQSETVSAKDIFSVDLNSAGTVAAVLYANTVSGVDVAEANTGAVASNAVAWGTPAAVSSSGKNSFSGRIRLSSDGTTATSVFVTDATGAATYSAIASTTMITAPVLTLAAVAATASARAVDFTLTSSTTVDCTTLTTDDLVLTGIKSILVTQKDTKTCLIAATSSTYWGEKGTASVAAGTAVSVSDSSGLAATAISGTASTAVDMTWRVLKGKKIAVKTLRQRALMTAEPGTAAVSTSVITTKASTVRCKVIKKDGKASTLWIFKTGACRVKVTDTWTAADGTKKTAQQYLTVTIVS